MTFYWFCVGAAIGAFLAYHIGYGCACRQIASDLRADRFPKEPKP